MNNNVILPSDPLYLTTTNVSFKRGLLPIGQGSAAEEKFYSTLMENKFDALSISNNYGTASYDHVNAIVSAFARSGNIKYEREALESLMIDFWFYRNQPVHSYINDSGVEVLCKADSITNPDGIADVTGECGIQAEWNAARMLSFASMYLLTGYRDFWSIVAYNVQNNQVGITSQSDANSNVIGVLPNYDTHRFNFAQSYSAMIAAFMIDATIPVDGQSWTGRVLNWQDQFEWTLNSLLASSYNLKFIPFSQGSGNVPTLGSSISQGSVSATLKAVSVTKNQPTRFVGNPMPTTGYLWVDNVTGGNFSAGALTGISAMATGPEEDDYRSGMVGVIGSSHVVPNYCSFTGSISGTTLTVTDVNSSWCYAIPGQNIASNGTYIVGQLTGTTGKEGTYEIYPSQTVGSKSFTAMTGLPTFQLIFPLNFLIDYYLNVKADSRIPEVIKSNLDIILSQIKPMTSTDLYYGKGNATWGYPVLGKPYLLENPINDGLTSNGGNTPFDLPEYARFVAFVLKTIGDDTVNGFTYSQWYNKLIDTANIASLTWQWKYFGQMFTWGQDASWMMTQDSLVGYGPETIRSPIQWNVIPGDTADGETPVADTTPPNRSGAYPANNLPAGTTSTTWGFTTNETATCKYSTSAGVAYDSMSNTMANTGVLTHSQSISGLTDGSTHHVYAKCSDASGNKNTTDLEITITVSEAQQETPVSGMMSIESGGTPVTFEISGIGFANEKLGYGKDSLGGHGGSIIHVTSLVGTTSEVGTLRYAIEQSGARTVVFDVSGNIDLQGGSPTIYNPYITIAGQTAPSPGITIINGGLTVSTHDVILEHLRIRPGVGATDQDALTIAGDGGLIEVYNVLVDHCSFTWAHDENVGIGYPITHDITIQNSIIAEGIDPDQDGEGGYGLLNEDALRVSVIGNLFAHNHNRNPSSGPGSSTDIVNNYVYDWQWYATQIRSGEANIINNYYKSGPSTTSNTEGSVSLTVETISPSAYVVGNIDPARTSYSMSDIVSVRSGGESYVTNTLPTHITKIKLISEVISSLSYVGARPLNRDSVDTRIINETINGTGGLILDEDTVGGFPVLANNTSVFVPVADYNTIDANGNTLLENQLKSLSLNLILGD